MKLFYRVYNLHLKITKKQNLKVQNKYNKTNRFKNIHLINN